MDPELRDALKRLRTAIRPLDTRSSQERDRLREAWPLLFAALIDVVTLSAEDGEEP